MENVVLTTKRGTSFLIDLEDLPLVSNASWHTNPAGYVISSSYKRHGVGRNTKIYLHRLLMKPAKGLVVDHINGNRLDNRKENLRVCTPLQNSHNRHKINNKTGFMGVRVRFDKYYTASIRTKGVSKYLGSFKTAEEASKAYLVAYKLRTKEGK